MERATAAPKKLHVSFVYGPNGGHVKVSQGNRKREKENNGNVTGAMYRSNIGIKDVC